MVSPQLTSEIKTQHYKPNFVAPWSFADEHGSKSWKSNERQDIS